MNFNGKIYKIASGENASIGEIENDELALFVKNEHITFKRIILDGTLRCITKMNNIDAGRVVPISDDLLLIVKGDEMKLISSSELTQFEDKENDKRKS